MKVKNVLFFSAVMCLAIACTKSKTEGTSDTAMATILNNDKCFDARMEQWFVKFNKLQDEGYGAEEANKKAIAMVTSEFKTCSGEPEAHIQEEIDSNEN